MKKTVRVNISGLVFMLDDDAYHKLNQYLEAIKSKFRNSSEGNEIISDVEARIAELFQSRMHTDKQVIILNDVDYIISVLGTPEAFDDSEEYEEQHQQQWDNSTIPPRKRRRLYRDPEHNVLGGVAAGMAHYFGIDPVILRVIFVVATLAYGTSALVYVLLWIILPEAKTASQKLEMKGQPVNLNTIEKTIKDEFNNVKNNISRFAQSSKAKQFEERVRQEFDNVKKAFAGKKRSKQYAPPSAEVHSPERRQTAHNISYGVGQFLRFVYKLAAALFAIFLVISGFVGLTVVTGLLFFGNSPVSPTTWSDVAFSVSDVLHLVTQPVFVYMIITGAFLLAAIPLLITIFSGLKILFNFRSNNKVILVSSIGVWVAGLIMLTVAGGLSVQFFDNDARKLETHPLTNAHSNVLYLDVDRDFDYHNLPQTGFLNIAPQVYSLDNQQVMYGNPRFTIEQSATNTTMLEVRYFAKGESHKKADSRTKNISYFWQQQDSVLMFDNYFSFPANDKWRAQEVDITLFLAVGDEVFLDEKTGDIIFDVPNVYGMWDYDMLNQRWRMHEDGLALANDPAYFQAAATPPPPPEPALPDTVATPETSGNPAQN